METLVGKLIDERYRVVELLGEGGMGRVYVAEHLKLGKRVAFKVVRADHIGNTELAVRFAREAMATSAIEHPNVVSALDYGTLPGRGAYLVMELARGPSLAELLEQHGTLHWSRAADIGAQIADALSAAHRHRIVHRDLKPDNIVVEPREDGGDLIKILDFGVARWVGPSMPPAAAEPSRVAAPPKAAAGITQTGMVIGTPGYMAPEQGTGEPAGFATDLYSLGIVLWEAIVGRPAFEGADLLEILQEQLREPLPDLRTATGDNTLPEELDLLVSRLCAILPEQRPSDAGGVRDVLRRVAQRATANAPPSRTEVEIVGNRRERTPLSTSSARPRPRGLRRSGVALGALGALGFAALLVWTGQLEVRPQGQLDQTVETLAKGTAAKLGSREAASQTSHAPDAASKPPPPRLETDKPTGDRASAQRESEVQGAVQAELLAVELGMPRLPEDAPWVEYVDVLVVGEGHGARLLAAEALLALSAQEPANVPRFALALARLQTADDCTVVEAALDELVIAEAAPVVAALELARMHPEAVCGPARAQQCETCLVPRLERELPALRVRLGARTGP